MTRSMRLSISSRPAASISSSSSAAAATGWVIRPWRLLREVADEVDQVVGDARRAAGARGDFLRAAVVDLDLEQAAAAADDALERGGVVVVEARLEREARAQRRGEQAGCAWWRR
jgi:hypothetical protein